MHIPAVECTTPTMNPLQKAAETGDLEGVQQNLHLQRSKDSSGNTALMKALQNGHVECAKLLLGELRMQNKAGFLAMMVAA